MSDLLLAVAFVLGCVLGSHVTARAMRTQPRAGGHFGTPHSADSKPPHARAAGQALSPKHGPISPPPWKQTGPAYE